MQLETQPHNHHKILVVEDDRTLREALRYNLVAAGYEVVVASDGGEGLVSARQDSPDVVVLDLMLPSLSGIEVCKALRRDGSIIPIIMLTARDAEIDRIGGLESGADDYVTKPFSMRELIARVVLLLHVPIPDAEHPFMLIRVVIHMHHHRQALLWCRFAREEAAPHREEEDLAVDPLHIIHHSHSDLGAIVRAVRE